MHQVGVIPSHHSKQGIQLNAIQELSRMVFRQNGVSIYIPGEDIDRRTLLVI